MDVRDGWSAAQVRAAERPLLEAGEPLMQRASSGLAAAVQRLRPQGALLVLAGSGSNGGDALFAAALLLQRGWSADVVRLGRRVHAAGLAAADRAGARVLPPDASVGAIAARAEAADVVLDGILGTGAAGSPALRAPARQVVAAIRPGPHVVAVDLPSGVGADDGTVHLPVLRADVTVTFGAVKAGLLLPPGRAWAGRIELVDLGLGPHLAGTPLVRAVDSTRPDNSGTLTGRR